VSWDMVITLAIQNLNLYNKVYRRNLWYMGRVAAITME
jgi:hypothetical protein